MKREVPSYIHNAAMFAPHLDSFGDAVSPLAATRQRALEVEVDDRPIGKSSQRESKPACARQLAMAKKPGV